MESAPDPTQQLEVAHVLFMDLVGYSRPPMDDKTRILLNLQRLVAGGAEFQRATINGTLVSLPTGDGMALAFFGDPCAPLRCARDLARELKNHPDIRLRSGIHSGPVYRLRDINSNLSLAGGGMNLAQRVMDCGDAGHILLSEAAASIVGQLSEWSASLRDLGNTTVKHGVVLHLYAFFDGSIGNPGLPEKLRASQAGRSTFVSFLDDVLAFLTVRQLPFDVIERGPQHLDLKVHDPSSLFPTSLLFCATTQVLDSATIEQIADRARAHGRFAHSFLLTPSEISDDSRNYALRRGLSPMALEEFRQSLGKLATGEQYVCGEISCRSLMESLAIQDVFIEPLATPAYPQDEMEYRSQGQPVPAYHLVDSFLGDSTRNMLVILGQYGAGKSSFCAKLAHKYAKANPGATAVYVPLRHVPESSDLGRIVKKAHQLAEASVGQSGRVLVILDGLDELPNAMDPKEQRQNMLRLIEASHQTDKLVLSARTSYFRGLSDFWHFFSRAKDEPLWDKLAKNIPGSKHRPRVSAIVLQEFNNAQIDAYVEAAGRASGRGADFATSFLRTLKEKDPRDLYRRLARSPVYLHLLVNTEPWNDPDVAGIGDVLRNLIKYWMQRDIEKGPSRWTFKSADRFEFIYALAWWMFERGKHSVSLAEFDDFVSQLYASRYHERDAMILDLQTTSLLSCSGNVLHFVLPGFFDYLIARQFAEGEFRKAPKRLPTGNQARILLSLLETAQVNESAWRAHGDSWRQSAGAAGPECEAPITLDPLGIVYRSKGETEWPRANDSAHVGIRAIINAALTERATADEKCIKLYVANRLGLHARPAALIAGAALKWAGEFSAERRPKIFLRREGDTVDATSIIGIMCLAAAGKTVVDLLYEGCSEADAESLLAEFAVRMPLGELPGDAAKWATPLDWDPERDPLERR
jgi:phosphotransferase system HPr (HPr) family protein